MLRSIQKSVTTSTFRRCWSPLLLCAAPSLLIQIFVLNEIPPLPPWPIRYHDIQLRVIETFALARAMGQERGFYFQGSLLGKRGCDIVSDAFKCIRGRGVWLDDVVSISRFYPFVCYTNSVVCRLVSVGLPERRRQSLLARNKGLSGEKIRVLASREI